MMKSAPNDILSQHDLARQKLQRNNLDERHT